MSVKAKTEKLHVLAVLGDGLLRNTHEISSKLEKDFDLKPRLNTLRKNLERCSDQGLVKQEKITGSYHYRISQKGKERLHLIRAKRQEKFEKSVELQRHLSFPEKLEQRKLLKRTIEVASAIKLCDTVLRLSSDSTTQHFAKSTQIYWQLEFLELVPHITKQVMKTIKRMSEQTATTIEHLLRNIAT